MFIVKMCHIVVLLLLLPLVAIGKYMSFLHRFLHSKKQALYLTYSNPVITCPEATYARLSALEDAVCDIFAVWNGFTMSRCNDWSFLPRERVS